MIRVYIIVPDEVELRRMGPTAVVQGSCAVSRLLMPPCFVLWFWAGAPLCVWFGRKVSVPSVEKELCACIGDDGCMGVRSRQAVLSTALHHPIRRTNTEYTEYTLRVVL